MSIPLDLSVLFKILIYERVTFSLKTSYRQTRITLQASTCTDIGVKIFTSLCPESGNKVRVELAACRYQTGCWMGLITWPQLPLLRSLKGVTAACWIQSREKHNRGQEMLWKHHITGKRTSHGVQKGFKETTDPIEHSEVNEEVNGTTCNLLRAGLSPKQRGDLCGLISQRNHWAANGKPERPPKFSDWKNCLVLIYCTNLASRCNVEPISSRSMQKSLSEKEKRNLEEPGLI